MINQIFIPTNAKNYEDICISWDLQKLLIQKGYSPGLMLVIFNCVRGVSEDKTIQYDNLSRLKSEYGNSPVVVMLSNFPIEEVDFLHNTPYAVEHIKNGIDFAKNLPIGVKKIVTFHIETLITKDELKEKDENAW